jgi:signal transduction histidine kinase
VRESLDCITEAGERAAELTRHLMAFARSEVTRPTRFDARDEITASARLIARVVGDHLSLQLELAEEPCWVCMDLNQWQQLVLNLAVNARDAMPEGGELGLAIERTAHGTVLLRVTDTGHGMDEATMRKAFQPFFTTKPTYEGTGLGLSTCHGIVAQAGGRIALYSELGKGTRVEVELPLIEP